jgi:hypothetical protein
VKSVKIHYLYKRPNTPEKSIYGSQNTCAHRDNRFSLISPITLIDLDDAVVLLGAASSAVP